MFWLVGCYYGLIVWLMGLLVLLVGFGLVGFIWLVVGFAVWWFVR